MNNRLIKGILYNLNNVASYNSCGLDRLVRIEESNHELSGCKECVYKDSVPRRRHNLLPPGRESSLLIPAL